jgi:hypothetical protein
VGVQVVSKRVLFEPLGRKTVIFSILVALLVFGVGGAIYLAAHNVPSQAPYSIAKNGVQSAVINYKLNNRGRDTLPIMNTGTTIMIDGNPLYIVDMCKLLESNGGILSRVPDGCAKVSGDNNDNCDSGNCNCNSRGHYIWAIDINWMVHSACVGGGCKVNGEDGDQGVWP